ncbi:RagB/SusD family nutrient uptake outer membrane protein [Coprobacter fastidiosus]|uniref:RagB/SusD family nutrient uptake outer membrane protein n=1 Tax=Coprobacter fastidiosus TaxID=1099853 RepID=UPI00320A6937
MKLSKILLGICFVTAGQFFSSCSLDETPYTSLPMSDYFQTPENFGFYLDGVYSQMCVDKTWGGAAIACMLYDDDDTQAGRSYRPGIDGFYNFTTRAADTWKVFFNIVQQANMFLYELSEKGYEILSPEIHDRYKGEALFLRAYAYLELARRFGGLPYRDGPYLDGISNPDCARIPQTEVYKNVAKDFLEASTLLPTSYNTGYTSADRGRPTRQAAWGMYMRTNLHLAGAEGYGPLSKTPNATEAEQCYRNVIEAGDSILKYANTIDFPALEKNYMAPFDTKNQNNCNEILFSAQLLTNFAGRGVEIAFTCCPPGSDLCGRADNGGGEVSLRWDFIGKKFYKNDKRIEWGVALVNSFYNNKSNEKRWYYIYNPYIFPNSGEQSGTIPPQYTCTSTTSEDTWQKNYATPNVPQQDETGYGFDKNINLKNSITGDATRRATPKIYSMKYTDPEATGKQMNGCDIILLRYADVLLMYAEAQCELNNISAGMEYLDKIRNRAGIPLIENIYPGIDQYDLRDSIRLERRRELYLEFNRRWDLVRWGEFSTTMTNAKRPRYTWQDLYPIPVEEISANGLINSNNPGW